MPAHSFLHLLKCLQKNDKFGDNKNTSANQKFAIFLLIYTQKLSQKHVAEMYKQFQN